jgi:glycosyltransferase involved in cell wall biosynthesis
MVRAPTNVDTLGQISAPLKRVLNQISRRVRQLRRLWGEGGSQPALDIVKRAVVKLLAPATQLLEVRSADVLAADLAVPRVWSSLAIKSEQRLVVNWVTSPPSAGSGGHTTVFRLIKHLEQSGHLCRIYLYDVYGGDAIYYGSRIREFFPWFAGEVNDVINGMADAHAVIATSWPTAYPVYNDRCRGKRFYLVQDFEPWFYPVGAYSMLAENTYRMGFHAITAGRYLAAKLSAEYGMVADAFDFGCDTEKYHLLKSGNARDGIVFYARPEVPRRAFELGLMVLRLFAERHPDLKIHFYGSRIGRLPFLSFPFINHGLLTPSELNRIYNRCFAGLSLSMTNVSLVPHEMLSAGCIPVVNEAEQNRTVLDNPFVRYAPPTPHALASALDDVVGTQNFSALATSASASVRSASWEAAGGVVERCISGALGI